jgi:hypothetical protein
VLHQLIKVLIKYPTFEELSLDLAEARSLPEIWNLWMHFVGHSKHLRVLKLTFDRWEEQATDSFVQALLQTKSLKHLKLSTDSETVSDSLASALEKALGKDGNTSLSILCLSVSYFSDAGMTAIMRGLANNTCITSLYVSGNNIRKHWAAVGAMLRFNATIDYLYLVQGGDDDVYDGIRSFAPVFQALQSNKTVKRLDVNAWLILAECTQALLEMLRANSTIQTIDIQTDSVEGLNVDVFKKALARNPNTALRVLSFSQLGIEVRPPFSKPNKKTDLSSTSGGNRHQAQQTYEAFESYEEEEDDAAFESYDEDEDDEEDDGGYYNSDGEYVDGDDYDAYAYCFPGMFPPRRP